MVKEVEMIAHSCGIDEPRKLSKVNVIIKN